jgi:hypothetical protein
VEHERAPVPAPAAPSAAPLAPRVQASGLLALQRRAGNRAAVAQLRRTQAAESGGLPAQLRADIEALSGQSLEGTKVHYDSPEPRKVGAYAFAQGDDIHLAPGEERHLPHEAWHITQQRSGRVRANASLDGTPINADPALEHEADRMGDLAMRSSSDDAAAPVQRRPTGARPVLQGAWAVAMTEAQVKRAQEDPIDVLLDVAEPYRALLGDGLDTISNLYLNPTGQADEAQLADMKQFLLTALGSGMWDLPSLVQGTLHAASDPRELVGADADHEDEIETDAPEIEITEDNYTEYLVPSQLGGGTLRAIFDKMAVKYITPRSDVDWAYRQWANGGPLTKAGFARLFQPPQSHARLAGSVSFQPTYVTNNFGTFNNVSYTLGAKGAIDFTNPTAQTTWSNPVDATTRVDLHHGCAKAGHGITKNNTAVDIKKASRQQHFSIANRIRGYPGTGSPGGWTWHHEPAKYSMVLVDRTVHQKHGHNGGFFLW